MQGFLLNPLFALIVTWLAQGKGRGLTNEDRSEIYFWLTVTVIVAIITGVIGFLMYQKAKKAQEHSVEEEDFSLSQMRRLYEAGELSHEEFTQLREKILNAARKSMLGDSKFEEVRPAAAAPVTFAPETASESEAAEQYEDEQTDVTTEEVPAEDTTSAEANTDEDDISQPSDSPTDINHDEPPRDEELDRPTQGT